MVSLFEGAPIVGTYEVPTTDDAVAAELIAKGDKRQVPYLVDSDHGVEMYESDDIVEYLKGHQA